MIIRRRRSQSKEEIIGSKKGNVTREKGEGKQASVASFLLKRPEHRLWRE